MNKLFHSGAKSGNKIAAEEDEQRMSKQFNPRDYLPGTTIKSYFSRRVTKKKKGEIIKDDAVMINVDSSCDETESEAGSDYDEEGMDMLDTTREEKLEKERTVLNQKISVAVSGVNNQKEEWIPVKSTVHSIRPRAGGSTSPLFEKINIKCQLVCVA